LLDEPQQDAAELAENFRDIERVNRLLGGTSIILQHLPPMIEATSSSRPVRVLDIATGSADIPIAVSCWAEKRQIDLTIVASDQSEDVLEIARKRTANYAGISIVQHDARSIPLPDRQFDIVLCSLSLHHFSPDDAVRVLGEMRRLARTGFILNDLSRSRIGYVAAWIAAHLTTRNRLTRHDAPLSVCRAYTPGELDTLMRRAGITNATILRHRWFRMAAIVMTTGTGQDSYG
jgi:ubiquinone/menaquinone biosynthesis C-methylase UbiE